MTEFDPKLFFIDTNILVYAYDTTDAQKHLIAKNLLERCWKKEVVYTLSAQNLAEFFVVATRKIPHPISPAVAEQIVKDISSFSHWKVLYYDATTVLFAIHLSASLKRGFWDALLAATMLQQGVCGIYTENTVDFKPLKQIAVINPFDEMVKA